MNWDEVTYAVKKTVGKTADKINQAADLATLQVKLTMLEHRLEDAYAALGKVSYKHFNDTETENIDEVAGAMRAVEAAQKKVDAMKAQIEKLKANA